MAKKAKFTGGEREELEALQVKRRDILEMLSRLEKKKHATRPHIYEKVRADYEERLNGIEEELKSREEAVRKELQRIAAEKKDLLRERDVLQEELEEVSLRHDAGEYSDRVFSKMEDEKRAKLGPLEAKLKELEEEEQPFKALAAIKEPVRERPVPKEEEVVEVEEPAKAEEVVEQAVAELREVEEPSVPQERAKASEISPELLAEEAALKESERELEELIKELEQSEVAMGHTETKESLDLLDKEPEEIVPGSVGKDESILSEEEIFKEEEKELEELLGGKETGGPSRDEGKGLLCEKCGTVNKPDSWYCEKCGAELIEA